MGTVIDVGCDKQLFIDHRFSDEGRFRMWYQAYDD